MNQPTQNPETAPGGAQHVTVTADRFAGYPIGQFHAVERRSLTVHLEDAGHWDVTADATANDSGADVWAGRFATFGEAATVADGLNRVWRAAPQATAAEVVRFVLRGAPSADAVDRAVELLGAIADRAAILRERIENRQGAAVTWREALGAIRELARDARGPLRAAIANAEGKR